MSNPKICEILKIEHDECFGFRGKRYWLNREDYIVSDSHKVSSQELCEIINHSEEIIRKHKWTQQDVEDAKVMKKYFPDFDLVKREMMSTRFGEPKESLYLQKRCNCNINPIGNLKCFPSLAVGEAAEIDEILKAELDYDINFRTDELGWTKVVDDKDSLPPHENYVAIMDKYDNFARGYYSQDDGWHFYRFGFGEDFGTKTDGVLWWAEMPLPKSVDG